MADILTLNLIKGGERREQSIMRNVDKYGLSNALIAGSIAGLLSVLCAPFICNNYVGFLVVRFLQAIGIGFIFPCIGYVAAHWFPEREHGLANGLFFGCVPGGCAVGALLSPFILNATGNWTVTLAILGIFNVIAIIFAYQLAGKQGPVQELEAAGKAELIQNPMTYADALKCPITWIGMVIIMTNAWMVFNLTNFVPAFLAEPKPMGAGLGAETSGILNLALTLIGFPAVLLGGWFYDVVMKGRAKLPTAIGFVATAVTFLLIFGWVQQSMFLLVIILMFAGFGGMFQTPPMSAYVVKIYPPEIAGSMIGWWFGGGTFGAAIGLFLGSLSIERTGSFNFSLIMISVVACAGLVLTMIFFKHNLVLNHPRAREIAKAWTR